MKKKKSIDKKLIEQLDQPEKIQFIVNLQKFNNICNEINSILSKHDCFLKVFELKNKFRHLLMKKTTTKKTLLDNYQVV